MLNLIVFQTVTKWDDEFGSQPHKKPKNKENFIRGDKFTFHKIIIVLIKSSPSE